MSTTRSSVAPTTTARAADYDALGVLRPDIEPRVTTHMAEIIDTIERLLANGNAYLAANGDVNFEVASFADYGQLSGQDLDALQAGARVEVDDSKRAPLDFVGRRPPWLAYRMFGDVGSPSRHSL